VLWIWACGGGAILPCATVCSAGRRWWRWHGSELPWFVQFPDVFHADPSRQTYLASVGLAMLSAWRWRTGRRAGGWWLRSLCGVLHNVGYLWTKKRSQFLERAAPTEQLIEVRGGRLGRSGSAVSRAIVLSRGAVHLGADTRHRTWCG